MTPDKACHAFLSALLNACRLRQVLSVIAVSTLAAIVEHTDHCFTTCQLQISGGHLNPALTLAMVAAGFFHWVTALIYIITQAGLPVASPSGKGGLPTVLQMRY